MTSLQLTTKKAIHKCTRIITPLTSHPLHSGSRRSPYSSVYHHTSNHTNAHRSCSRVSPPLALDLLSGSRRSYSVRPIGQPIHETHPHLIAPGELTRGITKAEFKKRRDKLVSAMIPNSVALFFSAPEKIMSEDIPYENHHNVQVSYLSGFQEVNAILLLEKRNNKNDYTFTMFVTEKTDHRDLWHGPTAGKESMAPIFGCDAAYDISKAGEILGPILSKAYAIYTKKKVWPDMFRELKLDSTLESKVRDDMILQQQMIVKSPAEQALMQTAADISGESFAKAMAFTKPGMLESCIHAKIEFEAKMKGAQRLAYPPVVAGGANGLALHYVKNNDLLRDGELVLVDAGCEYHGYASDITRTWPVSKKFSPAQREVYQVVLDCNKKCIEAAVAGATLSQVFQISTNVLNDGLISIGVLKPFSSSNSLLFHKIYPHHIGHYLGMDVHDCFDIRTAATLRPGMVTTIEPGVYIPAHPSIPERFHKIAIRIEDNIIIQESGPPIVLTRNAPKEIAEIEAIMR